MNDTIRSLHLFFCSSGSTVDSSSFRDIVFLLTMSLDKCIEHLVVRRLVYIGKIRLIFTYILVVVILC